MILDHIAELDAWVGKELGSSEWVLVDQGRIDRFAGATGDYQWIHVDPKRTAEGPFGTEATTKVNYGLNKVRFPAPVPVNSRVRTTATLTAVEAIPGGVQVTVDAVIHSDVTDKPACVAQPIFRFYA